MNMWPLYREKLINAATDLSLEEYDIVTSFDLGMSAYWKAQEKAEEDRNENSIRKNAYAKGRQVVEVGGLPDALMRAGAVSLGDMALPQGGQRPQGVKSHRVKRGRGGRRVR